MLRNRIVELASAVQKNQVKLPFRKKGVPGVKWISSTGMVSFFQRFAWHQKYTEQVINGTKKIPWHHPGATEFNTEIKGHSTTILNTADPEADAMFRK